MAKKIEFADSNGLPPLLNGVYEEEFALFEGLALEVISSTSSHAENVNAVYVKVLLQLGEHLVEYHP